jgi:cation:H+ antiporter
VGMAATISPITLNLSEVAVTLKVGLMALVLAYPTHKGFVERRRGMLLLLLYAISLASILQRQAA